MLEGDNTARHTKWCVIMQGNTAALSGKEANPLTEDDAFILQKLIDGFQPVDPARLRQGQGRLVSCATMLSLLPQQVEIA